MKENINERTELQVPASDEELTVTFQLLLKHAIGIMVVVIPFWTLGGSSTTTNTVSTTRSC